MPWEKLPNGARLLTRPISAEYNEQLHKLKPVALSASAMLAIRHSHQVRIEVQEEPPPKLKRD